MNNLRLLITAGVNEGASVSEINQSIKSMQSRVGRIKLRFDFDKALISQLDSISKQFSRIQQNALETNKVIETALFPDGTRVTRNFSNGLNGEFSDILRGAENTKKSMQSLHGISESVVKETRSFNAEMDKSYQLIKRQTTLGKDNQKVVRETWESQAQGIQRVLELDSNGQLIRQKDAELINKQAKQKEQALAYEQRVNNQIQKNTAAEAKKTQELKHQLSLYKQQAAMNVQNISRTHGTTVDRSGLDSYQRAVSSLSSSTPNVNQRMSDINMQFAQLQANARDASAELNNTNRGLQSLGDSIGKMALWGVAGTVIFGVVRSARELVSQLLLIDQQLTVLDRVTSGEANLTRMLQDSYDIADRLGNKMLEVNDAITGKFCPCLW
ncbi:hypothetical protein [Bacillus sp. Marseille-P3800]|uniref:hypothetical protein n=1 Tax=Bacillus sp. Marseille-P3800 TaxID=2014782 RepID=UPI000C07ABF3|nr:hypothetical protein [Bacillus sp. Marseille-P3800]